MILLPKNVCPSHRAVVAYQHFHSSERSYALGAESFYDLVVEATNNISVELQQQFFLNEAEVDLQVNRKDSCH